MNAFVVSDLHAHTAWPFSRVLPTGLPSRYQELLDVLAQVERALETCQVEDLLILGDLTHRRHFVTFKLYNTLWDALARLAERVQQTIILVGNHDYEDDTTHSLHVLQGLPNTIVVDQPKLVTLADGVQEVFALPYLHDPGAVARAVELAPPVPLVGHYGAEGCPLETSYWLDSPLKVGELMRFPQVIFGHIHKPGEQLGGKVQYVGAPLHFDFGDSGPRGGLHWLDGMVERVWLQAPEFVTARWPRIPVTSPAGGYLRLLDVPGTQLIEAKAEALRVGWRDCIPLEAQLPEAVREAVLSGLVVDRAMLQQYVARTCPETDEAERAALVDEGVALLEASRG